MNQYVFFAGAPGSKWSSVVKNIYWSDDFDHSDYSEERTYYHDADTPGYPQLMHLGAYWDPGMEFGNHWWDFGDYSKDELQRDYDAPFGEKSSARRIIKSHIFCSHLPKISRLWDGMPIVMVYRNDYECLEWWKRCGEFKITYPSYERYYQNLDHMRDQIEIQNQNIMGFIHDHSDNTKRVWSNVDLARELGIRLNAQQRSPRNLYDYQEKDIQVYVYQPK